MFEKNTLKGERGSKCKGVGVWQEEGWRERVGGWRERERVRES